MLDIYLKLAGIPGESVDADHPEWIEVLAISAGVSVTQALLDETSSPPQLQDLHFTKLLDCATPALFEAACQKRSIEDATFEFYGAGGNRYRYLTISLTGVSITSFQFTAQGASDAPPTEAISLGFVQITWSYSRQRPDGSPGAPIKTFWTLKT